MDQGLSRLDEFNVLKGNPIVKNEQFLDLLDERIAHIARKICHEIAENVEAIQPCSDASGTLRDQISFIKAKEHITVREAALLMSCSDSHIRKLVMLARKRKTARPIPFIELEGIIVFPLVDLLNWAKPQTRLQVIRNEAA